jgi:hypothetical protein
VFPPIDHTVLGEEEREMSTIPDISEPASELERLIADLTESGLRALVFGVGWWTAHLTGAATPVFRGPADRRWWHVVLGDDTASWTMSVRVDEITGAVTADAVDDLLGGLGPLAGPGASTTHQRYSR